MKLQQLRFLLAVVDNGLNMTQAAEALYTSQPGVSKQIRLLEEELGMPLFVRKGKRIESLTPAGVQVVERAQRALQEIAAIKSLAEELRGESSGQLSLATTQTQAMYVLPRVIQRFRRAFPDITFDLHQGTSEQIADMVDARRVDFAIASGDTSAFPSLITLPLFRWERIALVPKDHPLAREDKPLTLARLAEFPLVTYLFSERPASSFMSSFAAERLKPQIAFTARDSNIIKTYVRAGLGVGIIARMAIDPDQDTDLVAIELGTLFPQVITWLGYPREMLLKGYHRSFIQLLSPRYNQQLLDEIEGEQGEQVRAALWQQTPPLLENA